MFSLHRFLATIDFHRAFLLQHHRTAQLSTEIVIEAIVIHPRMDFQIDIQIVKWEQHQKLNCPLRIYKQWNTKCDIYIQLFIVWRHISFLLGILYFIGIQFESICFYLLTVGAPACSYCETEMKEAKKRKKQTNKKMKTMEAHLLVSCNLIIDNLFSKSMRWKVDGLHLCMCSSAFHRIHSVRIRIDKWLPIIIFHFCIKCQN